MIREQAPAPRANEDVWIPSTCGMCYNQCGILVHRVDGTVVKIEGNPKSPLGKGRLCPRGLAGLQLLYDPHRLDRPLRRTNPEKGIGVDPRWAEIGWDKALDVVAGKLKEVRDEDPRGLHMSATVVSLPPTMFAMVAFMPAFGSLNVLISDGHQCGNAEHILARTLHASVTTNPDAAYCDYLLLFGCQVGLGAYYTLTTMAQDIADARVRGMKVVVVDPYLSPAAEKADEWVPLRPGTDGALACALLSLLLNEYGLYDADYVARHTDGPYLVGSDGLYCRDGAGKPLVWDGVARIARPFDDAGLGRAAIEGSFEVKGASCKPVFQLLKEQVARWTPERASQVTTIPAGDIRRIALDFGQAARIGATITIEGRELPLRPAATLYFKGAHGHDNAWPTSLAIELLNEVVGASNVPGGLLGCNPICSGHPETGLPRWAPGADADGLLQAGMLLHNEPDGRMDAWPPRPQAPEMPNLRDLIGWPISTAMTPATLNDPENFAFPVRPKMLLNYGSNLLMSVARPEVCFDAFKDCFVVCVNLYSDETAEALADIVLPDTCYLERLDPVPNWIRHHFPVGLGDWGHQIRQPAVAPVGERRDFIDVLRELARRLGFADTLNVMLNFYWGLEPPYALAPDGEYTWEEIADRVYRCWFGPERGLDWFKANGVVTWPKRVEEVYWKPFTHARAPLYYEWVKRYGAEVRRIADERSIRGIDTSGFVPLPDWRPCQALGEHPGYDFQAIYYRVPWHTFSLTYEIPWLDEVSESEPYSYFVCVNTAAARARGLADGDAIWVEAVDGARVRGRVKQTEGIHPEVVAIANNGGHWARGMPLARGKGVFFNQLLPLDLRHVDLVSLTMDCDARVKLYKA